MYSHVIPIPNDDAENDDAPLYDDSKDACQDIDLSGIDEETIAKFNNEQQSK